MKKILATLSILALFAGFSFAQEAETAEAPVENNEVENVEAGSETVDEGTKKNSIRVGGFVDYDLIMGDLSDYASSSIGGGVSVEIDLPLPVALGVAVHGSYGMNTVKGELDSMSNIRFFAGPYFRLPIKKSGLIFQPELGIGAVVNMPKASDSSAKLESTYIDSMYQLGLGLRYANPKLAGGKLEIELTPCYTFCPESEASVQYFGARLGATYKVK